MLEAIWLHETEREPEQVTVGEGLLQLSRNASSTKRISLKAGQHGGSFTFPSERLRSFSTTPQDSFLSFGLVLTIRLLKRSPDVTCHRC